MNDQDRSDLIEFATLLHCTAKHARSREAHQLLAIARKIMQVHPTIANIAPSARPLYSRVLAIVDPSVKTTPTLEALAFIARVNKHVRDIPATPKLADYTERLSDLLSDHSESDVDAIEREVLRLVKLSPLYLYCEDFVGAVIGPFPSVEDVLSHIEYLKQRGDAAVIFHAPEVLSKQAARDKETDLWMTPKEDREYVPETT